MKRVKRLGVITTIFLAAGMLSTGAANSAVVQADWQSAGDNLQVYDDVTDLTWLDLTVTAGLSYNAVFAELGSGGDYEGYRFATSSEVETLFDDAGIPTVSSLGDFQTGNYTPVSGLLDLIGLLNPGADLPYSDGYTADTVDYPSLTSRILGRLQLCDGHTFPNGFTCSPSAVAALHEDFNGDDFADASTGSFLVLDVEIVPVPAALPLFLSGLAGLGVFARRRRKT